MAKTPIQTTPEPPDFLGKAGRKFWRQTIEDYDLEGAHHLRLLENACVCLDRAAAAREEIAKAGVTTTNRFGEVREYPACNTERQSMQVFRAMVRELGLDLPESPAAPRGPQRPGTRRA